MSINFKQCHKCGSKNTLKIIYGLPGPVLFQDAEAGKIKLGGCCIEEGDPEYACKACGFEWNYNQAVDTAYNKIKAITAFVGGHFGGSYMVKIDLINLSLDWIHWVEGEEIDAYQKHLRVETVARFIDHLKSVRLLNWKYKYEKPNVCDGTKWSVEIFREGRTLIKSGSNAYPDEWNQFCSIIGKIANRRFR